ncbi:hypothetical protein EI94DRAFT_1741886 [Lactarius quietus]|nr:hypothetical protein EI94DRAFT_1741886 [Lactarius quietus]
MVARAPYPCQLCGGNITITFSIKSYDGDDLPRKLSETRSLKTRGNNATLGILGVKRGNRAARFLFPSLRDMRFASVGRRSQTELNKLRLLWFSCRVPCWNPRVVQDFEGTQKRSIAGSVRSVGTTSKVGGELDGRCNGLSVLRACMIHGSAASM